MKFLAGIPRYLMAILFFCTTTVTVLGQTPAFHILRSTTLISFHP